MAILSQNLPPFLVVPSKSLGSLSLQRGEFFGASSKKASHRRDREGMSWASR